MYRCTLCFAHSVRDCYQNSQKSTQKASIVIDTMAKYLKRKCLLEAGVKVQTRLHFEALSVSWIFPEDRYYLQKAGQDFCRRQDSPANYFVQGQ